MTLLSIREQEAVQLAVHKFEAFQENLFCVRKLFAAREFHKDDWREWLTRLEAERVAVIQTLILATRDAIARQVRERGEQDEREGFGPYSSAKSVATFIEEMRCE